MTTSARIRNLAARKVRVTITRRISKRGYVVRYPVVQAGGGPLREEFAYARTMREAENVLLIRLRCWSELTFSIEPGPSKEEIKRRLREGRP